jgi:hypothetical protein
MRVNEIGGRTRAGVATLINYHPCLPEALIVLDTKQEWQRMIQTA